MAELIPLHPSMRAVSAIHSPRHKPRGMARIAVEPTQREMLERVALDIFADMSNSGYTFSEALGSIYLSGLWHALDLQDKDPK